ncbi:hypothetical protein ABK040_004767 [Willaertia magna]
MFNYQPCKIVVVGDASAGKAQLIVPFRDNCIPEYISTFTVVENVDKFVKVGNKTIRLKRQVSDEDINELQKQCLFYTFCDLFDLESINSTFTKVLNKCIDQSSLSGFDFVKKFKISITKTEEILKFVEINNYNELIKVCGEYDNVKYSKLKLFTKNYKDINLVYEIIIKFFTMHVVKIHSDNLHSTAFTSLNNNEAITIYNNVLLNILKEFITKYGENKFEISQTTLAKFITSKILKYQSLIPQIFNKFFNVSLLDYLINEKSNEKLPELIKIHTKQTTFSESIDLFEKPYIINERYVIVELLGEGGYGIVFKAFDIEKYIWVALKIVTAFESLNGFEREINVIKQLGKHSNIIEYLDYGYFQFNSTSVPFIAMERCDYSLNDKLFDTKNEFLLINKLNIFQQILMSTVKQTPKNKMNEHTTPTPSINNKRVPSTTTMTSITNKLSKEEQLKQMERQEKEDKLNRRKELYERYSPEITTNYVASPKHIKKTLQKQRIRENPTSKVDPSITPIWYKQKNTSPLNKKSISASTILTNKPTSPTTTINNDIHYIITTNPSHYHE